MAIKMYCVFSADAIKKMKGNRGKLAAQAGHAYLHAYWDAECLWRDFCNKELQDVNYNDYEQLKRLRVYSRYREGDHAYKICLVAESDEILHQLVKEHKEFCGTTTVTDVGFTVFDEPTLTCVGIGPIRDEDRSDLLKSLKVLI